MTAASMLAARSARSACCAQSRRTISCSIARCRSPFNSLTGMNSPLASARSSMEPSANGVSPMRPSCSRSCAWSSARLFAGTSVISVRASTSSPSAVKSSLSGEPAEPKARTSTRVLRPRAGAASDAKLSRARASSAACDVRTTRQPFGTGMRASTTWRVTPFEVESVRTEEIENPVTLPASPAGGSSAIPSPISSGVASSTNSPPRAHPVTTPMSTPRLSGWSRVM